MFSHRLCDWKCQRSPGKEELQAVKEAYNQLEEEHKQLSISAVHKAKEIHNSEVG